MRSGIGRLRSGRLGAIREPRDRLTVNDGTFNAQQRQPMRELTSGSAADLEAAFRRATEIIASPRCSAGGAGPLGHIGRYRCPSGLGCPE